MRRTNRFIALILGTILGFGVLPPAVAGDAMPLHVTVDGVTHQVDDGTTAGELLDLLGLAPKKANLVSLKGHILAAGAVGGRIVIDGAAATRDAVLEDGSVIVLEAARDLKERAERSVASANAIAGNPARGIPANYGVTILTFRGIVSDERVRVVDPPGADKKSAVAITFDDGPDPTFTPQIVAILARYRVKATFFWTGRNIGRYPKVVAAVRAAGHSIQNHTYNHENLGRASFAAQEAAIVAQIREMRKQRLPFPTWMRPPYGSYTPTTVAIAKKHGMRTIMWTVDPADYRRPAPLLLAKRVLGAVRPGGVILMHDGGGPRATTVAALPIILDALAKRGYRPVTLG